RKNALHPMIDFHLTNTEIFWTESDVFSDCFCKQLVLWILKDNANTAAQLFHIFWFFIRCDVKSSNGDLACCWGYQSVQMLDERRFSGTGVSDDRGECTRG